MGKEPRTAGALEAMINALLAVPGTFVSVQPDEAHGWRATVIIAPRESSRVQQRVDRIVDNLRKQYELIG